MLNKNNKSLHVFNMIAIADEVSGDLQWRMLK